MQEYDCIGGFTPLDCGLGSASTFTASTTPIALAAAVCEMANHIVESF